MNLITILKRAKKHFYCEDFGERKGCGQEVKLLKNREGKTKSWSPVKIPTADNEGEIEWRYIPHWAYCEHSREYFLEFMQKKAEEQAEWAAKNANNGGSGPRQAGESINF